MNSRRWSGGDWLAAGLLGVSVAVGSLLVGVGLSEAAGDAAGVPHPEFASMLRGARGGTLADGVGLLVAGWAYGALQIAFFGLCWVMSVRRADGLGSLRRGTWVAWIGYQLGWAALVLTYAGYARDPAATVFFGGFPAPTAVMLYVMWPLPLAFAGLYLWRFRERIHSEEDEARVRALMARYGRGSGGEDA